MPLDLSKTTSLQISQRVELGEIVLGFETRNKYAITTADGAPIAWAAEQQKGLLGMLGRQVLGHWRTFDIHLFDNSHQLVCKAHHPFRLFFQRLEVKDSAGQLLGVIQQRFGLLYKRMDILDPAGRVLMNMAAPFWRIWTFPLFKLGQQVAVIRKRWSGLLKESFTDADRFTVDYESSALSASEKLLALIAAIFVDLQYFEAKQSRR